METFLDNLLKELGDLPEQIAAKTPATSDSFIGDLRRTARDLALSLFDRTTKGAEEMDLPLLTVLRNLAASAKRKEFETIQIVFEFWARKSLVEPASDFRQVVEVLPASRKQSALAWLLLDRKVPGLSVLTEFFGPMLSKLLAAERELVLAKDADEAEKRTTRLLREIAAKKVYPFTKDSEGGWLKEGIRQGLPRLERKDFQSLQVPVRRWILESPQISQAVLSGALLKEIRANPLDHPDTPEAIAEKKWLKSGLAEACRDLGRRWFGSDGVEQLLSRPDLAKYSKKILKRLSQPPLWQPDDSLPCLPKTEAVRALPESRFRNALFFFSPPASKRLKYLVKLSPEARRDLLQDIADEDLADAILKSTSRKALRESVGLLETAPKLRNRVFAKLHESNTSDACVKALARSFLDIANGRSLSKLHRHRPETLSLLTIPDLSRREIRIFFDKHFSKPADFTILAKSVSRSLLRHLFKSDEPWLRRWRVNLARRALKLKSRENGSMMKILACALRFNPPFIGELCEWRLNDHHDFDGLLLRVLKGKPTAWHTGLLRFVDKEGVPCWENAFLSGLRPKLLKELIRSRRPALLDRVRILEGERLLASDSFKETLRDVLEGRKPARSLRVAQDHLRLFIPWARETWENRPILATAFELALAFSINEVRHLVALCSQRWRSGPIGKEGSVFDHLYRTHSLPKKSGGSRTVTVPEDSLKRLQRIILRRGFDPIFVHPNAHGFRKGRSILTNAQVHVGQSCVVNVDISSFFPNTSYKNILRTTAYLFDGGLSKQARRVVADICSFNGGLPTGAPTSPAIGNLVLRAADTAIAKVAKRNEIHYSRYADDLTFSGESNALKILPFVEKVLSQLGYQLDAKKTNIFRRGRRQMVTGLVVNEKPNLPRRIRRRLRAAVHTRSNGGTPKWHGRPMSDEELLGRLAMLQLVQPTEAIALKQQLTPLITTGQ